MWPRAFFLPWSVAECLLLPPPPFPFARATARLAASGRIFDGGHEVSSVSSKVMQANELDAERGKMLALQSGEIDGVLAHAHALADLARAEVHVAHTGSCLAQTP